MLYREVEVNLLLRVPRESEPIAVANDENLFRIGFPSVPLKSLASLPKSDVIGTPPAISAAVL